MMSSIVITMLGKRELIAFFSFDVWPVHCLFMVSLLFFLVLFVGYVLRLCCSWISSITSFFFFFFFVFFFFFFFFFFCFFFL